GEKVAYIEEGEQSLLLLRRNTKYTINGPATTVNDESGNEHVIWHVHLVPRELNENSPHDTDSTQKTKVAAFEKLGKNWVDSLDSKEQAAIVYYTGHNYTDINSYLRNNQMDLRSGSSKPELDEKIKSIDSAINKSVLEEDTVLYRNTGERELREKEDFLQHIFNIDLSTTETALSFKEYMDRAMALVQKNLGNTNTALAYTSTTIQKDSVFVGSAIRMEIRVPKGAHGAYVDSISQVKGEMEVLLPRESKFEITGASTVQENGYNVLVIRATLDITRDFNAEKKEAQQWGNKEYESWRNSLTKSSDIDRIGGVKTLEEAAKSECAALQYYSSINYKDINEYLRNGGGKNPSFEKVIEQIDNSLKKAETPETLYVYRRVDELAFGEKQNTLRDQNQKISDEKLNEIKDIVNTFRHKVIPEKSYMSTSLYNASSGLPILIRFKVPKGTHAACLGPVAKSVAKLDDGELLIARGSSYTIKAVERKTDKQGRDYLQVEATLNKN
ncbi:ADP-ribosyltransferase, partial [Brevibacillus laterosporus]|uniref:ADP-ribosyltransferase n=1 Tax=Brevibacillus laterosporus TaxID=1465 RepID=UPI002E23EC87